MKPYTPVYDTSFRKGTYVKEGSYYRVEVPPHSPLPYAIKALASQGGGIIQLGPHTYETSGTINLMSGVSICGIPGVTKIRKSSGDGPVVRVFTGARLEDCEIELNRTDGTSYGSDANPSPAWENSVVHLCEPSFLDRTLTITSSGTRVTSNGWQGTKYGAATISGCSINTLLSQTRGVYVSQFGVLGDTGAHLPVDFVNVRIINNTIIPIDPGDTEHSCIYFATGKYYGVCTGNICTAGDSAGVLGIIRYDGATSNATSIAFGGHATTSSHNLVSSNCAKYVASL